MTDIPKLYEPHDAEQKWFSFWEQRGDFNAEPTPGKQSHTIMIPLPNVTGALHMGHALNGTCQDLITRWRRMQGFEALWMPGTDHAGIATQAVVERRLLEEEGLTRRDVGREALVNRIWQWKDAYEKRIISQQKALGASCDWRRIRFTLDDVCAKAVRRTFFKMFSDGLIFRGKRLVNWDVHLQTAVADDEVFEEDVAGHFWTFHYPVVDESGHPTGDLIRYATTRPETMLGDTAVCVHPTDERYTNLIGKSVKIPLNDRIIPIIADALLADKEKGTGAVKVTPAHDPNDYACYLRNPEIGIINILNSDGTLNEYGGEWEGVDRLEVRGKVVERMTELGHFEGVEDRTIPLKHSDRSKTPVEPYLSDQWFVRMGDDENGTPGLAQKAIDAVEDGRVKFFPKRYAKTYTDWLGEKRDWCISRQLWWGHRIPIWSSPESSQAMELLKSFGARIEKSQLVFNEAHRDYMFAGVTLPESDGKIKILVCVDDGHRDIEQHLEAAGFVQDPDVLDTWFSSALWPHATLGWPDREHNPPLNEDEVLKQTQLYDSPGGSPGAQLDQAADDAHFAPSDPPGEQSMTNTQTGNKVLPYFYPGSVLITSRDIITLWVARMVLTGLYNMDDVPFRHVHVHPKILDGFGQTMSKSKGNGVDPVDLIEKYGADAIRFTIASFAGETQDVRLPISYECAHCGEMIAPKQYKLDTSTIVVPSTLKGNFPVSQGAPKPTMVCTNKKCAKESQFTTPLYDPDDEVPVAKMVSERFEYGRNFCNKFWNAARFAVLNLVESDNGAGYTAGDVTADQLQLEDRWILSRLSTVSNQMDEFLGRYQFDAATRAIRDFTWNEFCDWYLEMIKPRLRDSSLRRIAQRVLLAVLDTLVRLLHPFTPFICEDLWHRLGEIAHERALPVCGNGSPGDSPGAQLSGAQLSPQSVADSCINASWPKIPTDWQDKTLENRFERLQNTIVAVRNVRAIYNIPPGTSVKLLMRTNAEVADDLQSVSSQFDNLTKAVLEAAGADVERPTGSASFSLGDADGYIPLEGLIDTEAELERQQKKLAEVQKHIQGAEGKLKNENFVNSAPEQVVNGVRETLAGLESQRASIEEIIRDLS